MAREIGSLDEQEQAFITIEKFFAFRFPLSVIMTNIIIDNSYEIMIILKLLIKYRPKILVQMNSNCKLLTVFYSLC